MPCPAALPRSDDGSSWADFSPPLNDGVTKTGALMTYVAPLAAMGRTGLLKDREVTLEPSKSVVITITVAESSNISFLPEGSIAPAVSTAG